MNLKSFAMGLEFGSTRIKAILLDEKRNVIASGGHTWENRYVDGIWTYTMEDIIGGLQDCYSRMRQNFEDTYGEKLTEIGAIGISGMMHGYLAFDKDNNLLAPFRTWRNTITQESSETLTKAFNAAIPQRWSIAHLYKDILEDVSYVKDIAHFTTLAGFIHWQLTGNKVLGIGEASGMFPIDSAKCDYRDDLLDIFADLIKDKSYPWTLKEILPGVLNAGECAGYLTEEGAKLLDITGTLKAGVKFAPPEGDAGTGMTATNSVRVGTGNVSAGTSVFAMVVTEKTPKLHKEINVVTTPDGAPVAMVHCSNCTSDFNAWAGMLKDFADALGVDIPMGKIMDLVFEKALEGKADCDGIVAYNYYSGEANVGLTKGVPVLMRKPGADFSFANLARTHLYTCLSTLKMGLDILIKEENIKIDRICGHGGYFKAPVTGPKFLSAAVGAPVITMESSGEGGPYGMALLAAYMLDKTEGETLPDYLDNKIFASCKTVETMADQSDIDGFNAYLTGFKACLPVEKAAIDAFAE